MLMDFDKKKCFNLLEILLIHEIYYTNAQYNRKFVFPSLMYTMN